MAAVTLRLAILALLSLGLIEAADIGGTVVIKQRLTKRKVTAPVSSYNRGAAVELASDPASDPFAFERGRVVVYVEGQLPSEPVTATIEQRNRRFIPDTLVVPVGSTVTFPNLDPIFHNVFSLSKPKTFDLGNYAKNQTRTVTFPKPGIVFVNCHLHPNMSAVIVVSPNQWSTRAEPDGSFRLRNISPGTYTVVAWHRAAGFFRHQVQVPPQGAAAVRFVIPLDEADLEKALARR